MNLSELVEFGLCFSAETVKACALNGLHMTAGENALRSDRDSSLDLGEMWEYGCPKGPVWSDDGLEEERGEDTSSTEYYEHNVDNLAIELVGQNWSSEVMDHSFPGGLGGRDSGIKLPLVHGPFCAKK